MPHCSASPFVGNERATANLAANFFTVFRCIARDLDPVGIPGTSLRFYNNKMRQTLLGDMELS
jgi:hypothetical protein